MYTNQAWLSYTRKEIKLWHMFYLWPVSPGKTELYRNNISRDTCSSPKRYPWYIQDQTDLINALKLPQNCIEIRNRGLYLPNLLYKSLNAYIEWLLTFIFKLHIVQKIMFTDRKKNIKTAIKVLEDYNLFKSRNELLKYWLFFEKKKTWLYFKRFK